MSLANLAPFEAQVQPTQTADIAARDRLCFPRQIDPTGKSL